MNIPFKYKLKNLEKVFDIYTQEKLPPGLVQYRGFIKIRQKIILQAIDDMYLGNLKNCMDAISYFESKEYQEDLQDSYLPEDILEKMYNTPHKLADNFDYTSYTYEDNVDSYI